MHSPLANLKPVKNWLWIMAGLVAAMVIVGGATRLTDSGLSITEWQPLLGVIPPLTEAQWLEAFSKYQQIPEYQIQNRGMDLADFKFIYWWEWAHRLLGRFIGIAFAVPFLWFIATGKLTRQLWPRLGVIFLLGGFQGALGWYMVSSGLSERVDVSQYRLASHLSVAFTIFASIIWVALTMDKARRAQRQPGIGLAMLLLLCLFLQIAAGGFVAGLDAGHASGDWPQMNGAWIPDGLWSLAPAWRNLFENALATQFNHRLLAYAIVILALVQALAYRTPQAIVLLAAIVSQAILGILTVVLQVPLLVALLHQGGALVVLALALWNVVALTRVPAPDHQ
jgi:cytochrome c oxidase assembly protein subunit 15